MTSTRIAELAKLQVLDSEQLRQYVREVDKTLADFVAELECRSHELNGLIGGLLEYCRHKGIGDGKQIRFRAARVTIGFVKAALALRLARHEARTVHRNFERILAVELAALRAEKYGKKPARKLEVV